MMLRWIVMVLLGFFTVSVLATNAVSSQPALSSSKDNNKLSTVISQSTPQANITPVLFIQMAGSAVLLEQPGSDGKRFVLKMNKLAKNVLYFADQASLAVRMIGHLSNGEFAACWDKGSYDFHDYPPEGALVAKSFKVFGSFGVRSDVFSLANPTYNAVDNSVTYQVTPTMKYHPKLGVYTNVSLYMVKRLAKTEAIHSLCGESQQSTLNK